MNIRRRGSVWGVLLRDMSRVGGVWRWFGAICTRNDLVICAKKLLATISYETSIQRNFLSLILSFNITFFVHENFWPKKVGGTVVIRIPSVVTNPAKRESGQNSPKSAPLGSHSLKNWDLLKF